VSNQIQITVNGQARQIPAGLHVRALLDLLGLTPDRVAVELNRAIVRKTDWDRTQIEDGARLEVVQFVGGG
jgi:thiamine biosynthesis protein ThiS